MSEAPSRDDAVTRVVAAMGRMRHLTAALNTLLERELGMSVPQATTLAAVQHGARSIGDVARATTTHMSSASRTVDQLVHTGHLLRGPDPEDRRAVVLELTPRGREVLERLTEVHTGLVHRWIGALTPGEAIHFAELLDRFVARIADEVSVQA